MTILMLMLMIALSRLAVGRVVVLVIVLMVVFIIMRTINKLRQGIILRKGRVMTMLVPTTIGTVLRLKRQQCLSNLDTDVSQHVCQDRVDLEVQIVGSHLNGDVPIAEVVGRPEQVMLVLGRHTQHILTGGDNLDKSAIIRDQDLSRAHDTSPGQTDRDLFAGGQGGLEPTFASLMKRQDQLRTVFIQGPGQAASLDFFGDCSHRQNRK